MKTILSRQSLKAWVGAATTLLSPLFVVLTTTDEPLTLRVVLTSVLSGLIGGASVYGVTNEKKTVHKKPAAVRLGRHEAGEENSSPGME